MKQKILTLLLMFFMLGTVFSMDAEATELEEIPLLEQVEVFEDKAAFAAAADEIELYDYGYCNSNVMWGITPDGILIIAAGEGTCGTMPDYSSGNAPWKIYKDYIWYVKDRITR